MINICIAQKFQAVLTKVIYETEIILPVLLPRMLFSSVKLTYMYGHCEHKYVLKETNNICLTHLRSIQGCHFSEIPNVWFATSWPCKYPETNRLKLMPEYYQGAFRYKCALRRTLCPVNLFF